MYSVLSLTRFLPGPTYAIKNNILHFTKCIKEDCFLTFFCKRRFHASSRYFGEAGRKWQYSTNYTGELVIRSNTNCQFNIAPLDPVTYPNQDIALISHSKVAESLQVNCLKNVITIDDIDDVGGRSRCDIRVPIKFNIDMKLGGRGTVTVSNMENDSTLIHAQYGHCVLHNLKTAQLDIHSDHGTVISEKSLQTNGQMTATNRAGIRVSKLIGERVAIMSQNGDIRVKNVYVQNCYLLTENGSIFLGQTHQNVNADITEKGNLNVDSLDGTLKAKINQGDVDIFVQRSEACHIEVAKGDINFKVPTSLVANVILRGSSVVIDPTLNYESRSLTSSNGLLIEEGALFGQDKSARLMETSEMPQISLICHNGSVEIKGQSWASTLRLG